MHDGSDERCQIGSWPSARVQYVGHQAGGDATIDARKEFFKEKEEDAAILVDATNVFNSINI